MDIAWKIFDEKFSTEFHGI